MPFYILNKDHIFLVVPCVPRFSILVPDPIPVSSLYHVNTLNMGVGAMYQCMIRYSMVDTY